METLDKTEWDVLIVGTGLQQSLLALALSRSDKKILHVDEDDFYGGAEAAFSLQEAEDWAQRLKQAPIDTPFSDITITKPEPSPDNPAPRLSVSRAYNLSLSPQIVYARSSLLGYLVSSRVYRQLEFLAVGSWWVYSRDAQSESSVAPETTPPLGTLLKVPNGREDVFQDHHLDFKAKRALMKFLRFIGDYEEQTDVWEEFARQPFAVFLRKQFKIPANLQAPLMALTLSTTHSFQTTTETALPRIAKHLRSIGVFGPGFGAVVPKWGGLSEISQVSCRACAVGGGVYVLGKGVAPATEGAAEVNDKGTRLRLKDGEEIVAQWVIGGSSSTSAEATRCRSISIVSSSLLSLFPPIAEEAPTPATAVVVFPSGSLTVGSEAEELPPVHVYVHSSDTGECPTGQCVLYALVSLGSSKGFTLLDQAVDSLLSAMNTTPAPKVLWSAKYQQQPSSGSDVLPCGSEKIIRFPPPPMDLAFDDGVLDNVKSVWEKVTGQEGGEFLRFQDREAYTDDD
ncbi:hypothetical protein COCSADRAFT_26322 [Bipolaris sorokiniana ND90Pr]|uniref:Rab proteins geranylgeranyltransferase n=1 Tax=Cochliobolus sativus (strain ND90Pr / ATCC 201652) TaxID=665912 RepID=M2RBC5_COCSN|nr:uncharacterized protein COCSADRAFT_26322 [Bipolaris sorokiniana ND90Pr]EMD64129.1 hypothetical protein COCSADRAFT_26322 [Bipolaris sorokiniana ND90Pr]